MSFKKFIQLKEVNVVDRYDDQERTLYNYFLWLFQRSPNLMADSTDIAEAISRWQSDPYWQDNHRWDLRSPTGRQQFINIVYKAREDARAEYTGRPQTPQPQEPETHYRVRPPQETVPQDDEPLLATPAEEAEEDPYDYYFNYRPDQQTSKRLTRGKHKKIIDMAKEGGDATHIAFELDLPIQVVQDIIDKSQGGVTRHKRIKAIEMAKLGDSAQQIAASVGLPLETVQKILKRAKLSGMEDRMKWDRPITPEEDREFDAWVVNQARFDQMRQAWPPPNRDVDASRPFSRESPQQDVGLQGKNKIRDMKLSGKDNKEIAGKLKTSPAEVSRSWAEMRKAVDDEVRSVIWYHHQAGKTVEKIAKLLKDKNINKIPYGRDLKLITDKLIKNIITSIGGNPKTASDMASDYENDYELFDTEELADKAGISKEEMDRLIDRARSGRGNQKYTNERIRELYQTFSADEISRIFDMSMPESVSKIINAVTGNKPKSKLAQSTLAKMYPDVPLEDLIKGYSMATREEGVDKKVRKMLVDNDKYEVIKDKTVAEIMELLGVKKNLAKQYYLRAYYQRTA